MFTTPCFIRKNTPELRKKLEELGYEPSRIMLEDDYLCIATAVTEYYTKYTVIDEGMFDSSNPHITWNCAGRIDCGTNEELFIAISALRDDSDKYQWFTDGKDWYFHESEVLFDDCTNIFEQYGSTSSLAGYHKATVEELIKHFNHG